MTGPVTGNPAPGAAGSAAVASTAAAWEALLAGRARPVPPSGAELVERYGPLVAHRGALVLAQLGQSLDGFIASHTGHAEFVTGPEDREHLHRLRALVDAVIVGVGTVVADDCLLTVRAVPGPHPTRVVLDPSARAPLASALFTDGAAPTLWVVGEHVNVLPAPAPHVTVLRVPVGEDGLAPSAVLEVLARRGLRRVLVEGGGRTVSRFLAAGTLHRLYLTTAPMLIGDGVPGIRFAGAEHLSGALRAPVRRFVLGDDLCTELTFRA
ncbi:RibD family protein [Kocuria aegyptia]|uniref:Bacterial bifunctional deaminase-reductase C-terminal domain-containing protein n=1 Tax=Kocuria aegyptia TaxID=330943 RepID=A0ABN2KSW9_9MICC